MRPTPWLAAALGIALVAGCSSGGNDASAPVPGTLTLTMSTVNSGDGAIQVQVSGGPIDTVVAQAGYVGYPYRVSATSVRIIVAGALVNGPVATIHVPDVHKASSYLATVQKGADNSTYLLRSGGSYQLTVAP
jgi:small ligand-binding sensory domain FIST